MVRGAVRTAGLVGVAARRVLEGVSTWRRQDAAKFEELATPVAVSSLLETLCAAPGVSAAEVKLGARWHRSGRSYGRPEYTVESVAVLSIMTDEWHEAALVELSTSLEEESVTTVTAFILDRSVPYAAMRVVADALGAK